jgi:hypothetical protein
MNRIETLEDLIEEQIEAADAQTTLIEKWLSEEGLSGTEKIVMADKRADWYQRTVALHEMRDNLAKMRGIIEQAWDMAR